MIKKLIILLLLLPHLLYAEADKENFLFDFIAGSYTLIGYMPGTDRAYHGNVNFDKDMDRLQITRRINGHTAHGEARIEKALHGETDVLRIRFRETDKDYEETCLIGSDLDNYPRLTCYLYQPDMATDQPGLEAYFINR